MGVRIGHHKETLPLFVTDLAEEHPVILGLPWLNRHNPNLNWVTMGLSWNNAARNDASQQIYRNTCVKPPAWKTPDSSQQYQPYRHVGRRRGRGEPWQVEKPNNLLEDTPESEPEGPEHGKRSESQLARWREKRKQERIIELRNKMSTTGAEPRWTQAPPHARARIISNLVATHPEPARRAGPQWLPAPRAKAPLQSHQPDLRNGVPDLGPMDPTNIKQLNAATFMTVAK
ncbi:hypothetical protein B0H66DRAFT_595159 [Apodospora peruviana]|uniref:Uncharacterized protein n=1 Tax=Apodospora peruviana TaxID=516989 RepID=A0AAE0HTG8_9PEZI|nr:hypothetical protein B0H66DRAFT_595159 [Apodospora peruviana]